MKTLIKDIKDANINGNRFYCYGNRKWYVTSGQCCIDSAKLRVRLMGTGIMICGLNGSGKSTLGKALAEKLHYHFIDDEDLYFSKTDSGYSYASSRTRKEAEICTRRKKGSLTLSNPVLRILSKNGYNH